MVAAGPPLNGSASQGALNYLHLVQQSKQQASCSYMAVSETSTSLPNGYSFGVAASSPKSGREALLKSTYRFGTLDEFKLLLFLSM